MLSYKQNKKDIMQPIFTMQYGEFKVSDFLAKNIRNSSVFIPASAQEKGIDLLLYRNSNGKNKVVTIQVKMSRTYYDHNNGFDNHLWFNRFVVQPNADWYILMGIYARHPKKDQAANSKVSDTGWDYIMLAFTNTEMKYFMDSVRQKKNPDKPDSMFGFSFNEEQSEIRQTRGYHSQREMSEYLIRHRIKDIEASFDRYDEKNINEEKHWLLTRHITKIETLMDTLKGIWRNLPWGYSNNVMNDFEQDTYTFIDCNPELLNYRDILDEYGIDIGGDGLYLKDVSNLDDRCVDAMLFAVMRSQHHNEAELLHAIMSGAVVKWLKKLKASDEAKLQTSKL